MPRNRRSPNFYAAEARIQDVKDADQFCADRALEGLFASVIGRGEDSFTGLVIAAVSYNEILATENYALKKSWVPSFLGDKAPVSKTMSNPAFFEHPLARQGLTRMIALSSSYQAFLGSVTVESNPGVDS